MVWRVHTNQTSGVVMNVLKSAINTKPENISSVSIPTSRPMFKTISSTKPLVLRRMPTVNDSLGRRRRIGSGQGKEVDK